MIIGIKTTNAGDIITNSMDIGKVWRSLDASVIIEEICLDARPEACYITDYKLLEGPRTEKMCVGYFLGKQIICPHIFGGQMIHAYGIGQSHNGEVVAVSWYNAHCQGIHKEIRNVNDCGILWRSNPI